MKKLSPLFRGLVMIVVVIGIVLSAGTLALATSNYQYKPNEYVTIKHGKSPDGAWSIATHGEGELGDDHFNVYLMDGKTGKKIGPLTEISDAGFLDTAATAYHANWTPDSHFVTISYRSDRHTISAIKYKIENRRAYKVKGPAAVTSDKEAAALGWPDPEG
jgi:hypothetical protein